MLLLAALAVSAFVVPAADAQERCAGATARAGRTNLDRAESAVLCLVNRERAERGLPELRRDERLARAAGRHSSDMVRRGYFDHASPGGGSVIDRVRSAGYLAGGGAWSVAENIAWGSGAHETPARIVAQWMRSPGHRSNILERGLRDAGVGAADGSPRGGAGATYTVVFGRRG